MRVSRKTRAEIELQFLEGWIEEAQKEIEEKKLLKDRKAQVIQARKKLDDLEKELLSM